MKVYDQGDGRGISSESHAVRISEGLLGKNLCAGGYQCVEWQWNDLDIALLNKINILMRIELINS